MGARFISVMTSPRRIPDSAAKPPGVTSETRTLSPIILKANNINTSLSICQGSKIDKSYLDGFSYIEHPDNIALALKVCKEIGISEDKAIDGMRKSHPDPGSLSITKIKFDSSKVDFVNAFVEVSKVNFDICNGFQRPETGSRNFN